MSVDRRFEVSVDVSLSAGFRCARCGDCCRAVRVPLTDVDLCRLTSATQLPPSAIVDWLSPDEIDMTGEPETFVRLPEGRRLMVLRHSSGGCRFLHDDQCSVHPNRPTACAAFPFYVEDNTIERLPSPCRPSSSLPLSEVEPLSRHLTVELENYAWRVTAWNRRQQRRLRFHRRPESAERFFGFLSSQ